MSIKLFVGNLKFSVTSETLQSAFSEFGNVVSAKVINDRQTGKSRGFGFVEMENETEANTAIQGLNGKELDGRKITVTEAKPKD